MKTPMPKPAVYNDIGYSEDQMKAAMVAAWNEAIDEAIGLLESGSFLHEDAPAARLVRAAVPAIRTLKETP